MYQKLYKNSFSPLPFLIDSVLESYVWWTMRKNMQLPGIVWLWWRNRNLCRWMLIRLAWEWLFWKWVLQLFDHNHFSLEMKNAAKIVFSSGNYHFEKVTILTILVSICLWFWSSRISKCIWYVNHCLFFLFNKFIISFSSYWTREDPG
jgi:hypothetical protein